MPKQPLAVLTAPHNTGGISALLVPWNKVPPHSTNMAGRPKPAPASLGPRPRTSLATSYSLLPPAVLLQLLQLLLHEVGLSSGLRELECTANNNRSELKAHEAFPTSQHNRDLQPQARSCRKEFVPVEQGGSCPCHTSLKSSGKPRIQLALLPSVSATKAIFQF